MPRKSIPQTVEVTAFRRRLLAWFRRPGRDQPWRRSPDPNQVQVCEVIHQQTQVARVESFYPAFLAAFPTVARLAAARPARVREQWEGLGYYRRAAHLHRLSREVRAHHGGRIPDDPAVLRGLPGVGRYTAGAVASFAYDVPAPILLVARLQIDQVRARRSGADPDGPFPGGGHIFHPEYPRRVPG
jgi:A/G-specific adenine glycosylase